MDMNIPKVIVMLWFVLSILGTVYYIERPRPIITHKMAVWGVIILTGLLVAALFS